MKCHICFDIMKNDYLDTCDACIKNITDYIKSTKKIQRTECDIINFTIFFFRQLKISNDKCFICNDNDCVIHTCKQCHYELYKRSLILLRKNDEFISTLQNAISIKKLINFSF